MSAPSIAQQRSDIKVYRPLMLDSPNPEGLGVTLRRVRRICGTCKYDAGSGSFNTADLAEYKGGTNLYGYCGGDPVNRSDPVGTDWMWNGKDRSWDVIYGTPYVPYPDRDGISDGEVWTDLGYLPAPTPRLALPAPPMVMGQMYE